MRKLGLLITISFLFSLAAFSQQSTAYTEANEAYKRGIALYSDGVFGQAQIEYKRTMELLRPVNEPEWADIKLDAELQYAKCAVRLEQPEAEKLVLEFLRANSPSPYASQAALEIGDYYFNDKKYKEAIAYYDMAPAQNGALRTELQFKKGYAYFVDKNFTKAKNEFYRIKEQSSSEYYYPSNYYYACCMFFEGRYDEASKSFLRCEADNQYNRYVPYYVCQIYSAQKNYNEVIKYGAPKAKDGSLRNLAEINLLVGQAYYELSDFKSALPYLEYAANQGANLRPADFYQIGYTQYQAGYYTQAIANFQKLTKQDSVLGQNGLYHLGDSYLKTGNKFAARTAFAQAADMMFDPTVTEDALFNFAKLSYELKYDRDALTALQRFTPKSRYYNDALALMGEIFLNTRDYDRAVTTLEGISDRSQRLNGIYQKVTFLRGLQLYQNGMKSEAEKFFNKSMMYSVDKNTTAQSNFWLGNLSHQNGEYDKSKQYTGAFLDLSKSVGALPDEASPIMGNYTQGYNYLKTSDYKTALAYFNKTVDGIDASKNSIYIDQIKSDIYGDAILRIGDCYFKEKQYKSAKRFYDIAVTKQFSGFEYALYQKAIIQGLQKEPLEKILSLEKLVDQYPNSRYTDDALFQLGITYQEMNQLDRATKPLRDLVEKFRGKSALVNPALLRLGLISYNRGDNQAALNYYKQVFANNPENDEAKDALVALEEIYVKELNQPDEYFKFLETVPGYKVDVAEKDAKTFEAAEAQYNNARYTQAITGYSNYLAKYPRGANVLEAMYHRGESYASDAVKDYKKAYLDYVAVVEKGSSRFYGNAAEKAARLAYNVEQDFTQAYRFAKIWEASTEIEVSRLDAQIIALQCSYRTKNASAVEEYANKVNNNPSTTQAQKATANYYLGKIAYDSGQYAKAYNAFEKVAKNTQSEEMAESYHLMATVLYRDKRYGELEDFISNINKASAGYDDWIARNLILLSDLYNAQGDKASAKAALEAVIENYKGKDASIKKMAQEKLVILGGGASSTRSPASVGSWMDDGN